MVLRGEVSCCGSARETDMSLLFAAREGDTSHRPVDVTVIIPRGRACRIPSGMAITGVASAPCSASISVSMATTP